MTEILGVTASAVAVAELSTKIVKVCAQYTKDVANAREDIERFKKEVNSLGGLAKDVQHLMDKSSPPKVSTLTRLQSVLDESQAHLKAIQTKLDPGKRKAAMSKFGLRALTWPFKSQDINKAVTELIRLTQRILLAMQVDQTTILLDIDQKAILAKLPIAEGATYDSYADEHNPQCLPDTRIEVLSEITKWAYDPLSKTVYWLNGMAGTGKSTISRTLAQRFSENNRLGATFFFKRGEGDRSGMSKLFTTIVSQLMQQLPGVAGHVQATMETDPAISSKVMREQFQKLIINPVSQISLNTDQPYTCLIVIDALDECEREEDVGVLIKLFSSAKTTKNLKLKFFFTSRPELPIRLSFKAINGIYQDFILHEVAELIIEHDLAVYLKHNL